MSCLNGSKEIRDVKTVIVCSGTKILTTYTHGGKGKAVHRRALQITLAFIDKYTLLLKNVVI